MPNFSAVLKDEVARIARKEMRKTVDPMKKQVAGLRRDNAALKRENAALKREQALLAKAMKRESAAAPQAPVEAGHRFSASGLKKLRAKLGISAQDFGKLAGVSALSIYNWESGKVRPRGEMVARIAELRGMGKREVQQLLEEQATAAPRAAKARKRRRKAVA